MAQHPTSGHFHARPHVGGRVHHPWAYHGPYYHRVAQALGARGDQEIEHDVKDALFWDTWLDANKVAVEVKDRVVTLTGTVDSFIEKIAASEDAWGIPGVADVDNNLQIAHRS